MTRLIFQRARTALLAALCAGVAVVAVPTAAIAATPESACGSGFVRASDGSRAIKTMDGTVYGYVYLMWNNSTQQNCVATIKTAFVGTPTWTEAFLEADSGWYDADTGNYKYYAVTKFYAPGQCVKYFGYITSGLDGMGTGASGGRQSWGNCS